MDELKRYFLIANKLRSGSKVSRGDIEFFYEYSPEIDEAKMQKLIEGGEFASREDAQAAIFEAGKALQSSPEYKEQTLRIAEDAEAGRVSANITEGLNMIMGGVDIASSINQIRKSDQALSRSRRPSRPSIPQRDVYLQQALRSAEEGTMDAGRALAPVQAQINDQYLSDMSNAKTASTGQSGQFGAYAQLAANRRNRSAMQLAPLQDEIRRGQQARYDNLLGQRLDETQNMFQNQASLYPYDLQQYNRDQDAAAALGSTGRMNLRDSLYNFAGNAANTYGRQYTRRKYDQLRNQAMASGLNPDLVTQSFKGVDDYAGRYKPLYGPEYYEQSFIG